jgi:hypothetical protein
MLDVQKDFLLFSVVSDERVQSVAMGHPTNQTTVCRQWNNSVPLKKKISAQNNSIEFLEFYAT